MDSFKIDSDLEDEDSDVEVFEAAPQKQPEAAPAAKPVVHPFFQARKKTVTISTPQISAHQSIKEDSTGSVVGQAKTVDHSSPGMLRSTEALRIDLTTNGDIEDYNTPVRQSALKTLFEP